MALAGGKRLKPNPAWVVGLRALGCGVSAVDRQAAFKLCVGIPNA